MFHFFFTRDLGFAFSTKLHVLATEHFHFDLMRGSILILTYLCLLRVSSLPLPSPISLADSSPPATPSLSDSLPYSYEFDGFDDAQSGNLGPPSEGANAPEQNPNEYDELVDQDDDMQDTLSSPSSVTSSSPSIPAEAADPLILALQDLPRIRESYAYHQELAYRRAELDPGRLQVFLEKSRFFIRMASRLFLMIGGSTMTLEQPPTYIQLRRLQASTEWAFHEYGRRMPANLFQGVSDAMPPAARLRVLEEAASQLSELYQVGPGSSVSDVLQLVALHQTSSIVDINLE